MFPLLSLQRKDGAVSHQPAETEHTGVVSEEPAMAPSVDAKVVIIGCGISGIAAACRLVEAGFHHVRILEATSRGGGRVKTGRLGERSCAATSYNSGCSPDCEAELCSPPPKQIQTILKCNVAS